MPLCRQTLSENVDSERFSAIHRSSFERIHPVLNVWTFQERCVHHNFIVADQRHLKLAAAAGYASKHPAIGDVPAVGRSGQPLMKSVKSGSAPARTAVRERATDLPAMTTNLRIIAARPPEVTREQPKQRSGARKLLRHQLVRGYARCSHAWQSALKDIGTLTWNRGGDLQYLCNACGYEMSVPFARVAYFEDLMPICQRCEAGIMLRP
jgi:hypothetical protein